MLSEHDVSAVDSFLKDSGIIEILEPWSRIKTALAELGTTPNSASTKLRKIIIELGCRGVLGASERDTAIVDEICKREGIVL